MRGRARSATSGGICLLKIHQTSIAGTPIGSTQPLEWNGSLWTLFYEFLCYLILMGLATVGLLRRRFAVLVLTLTLMAAMTLITFDGSLNGSFNVVHHFILMNLIRFGTIFLTGALLYLYRDRVPDSGWIALVCTVLLRRRTLAADHPPVPRVSTDAVGTLVPLIAYPMIWLGYHLPFQRVGAAQRLLLWAVHLRVSGATALGHLGCDRLGILRLFRLDAGHHIPARHCQLVGHRKTRSQAQAARAALVASARSTSDRLRAERAVV